MGLFDFLFRGRSDDNMTRGDRRTTRGVIDWTEKVGVNRELTYGLYHNQAPGLKLAGSLAFAPIAVPVWFMGVPIAESDDEVTQEILTELCERFFTQMQAQHTEIHRDGGIWVWPYYSAEDRAVMWEVIPDTSVITIYKSLRTGKIVGVKVDEELILSRPGGNDTARGTRTRIFTRETIEIRWEGFVGIPDVPNNEVVPNVAGILPIGFPNNADVNESRGHSDYDRIIYDLKNYHDIELMQSTILAKFNPKLIVEGADPKTWLKNNGFASINDVDVARSDLFLQMPGEKVDFAFPENAYQAYETALKRTFRKIVEGSVVPEICWGLKSEGNHASVEGQMGMLLIFVEDKRTQKTEPYKELFAASLRLMGVARMQKVDPDIRVVWGNLDKLSAKTKAEVFRSFAEGAASLVSGGAVTKLQLYNMWNNLYPSATYETYEEFVEGLAEMAKHKQYRDADWEMARDEF